ncbi:MAG: non-ribosomal peptide synthetase, partial [bacterium]|nr:non-ribosomal peptide synthetase [bacterium]
KVDRRRLPAPERSRPELEKAFRAPAGATEEAVAKIFARITGKERVGVDDNFFELGGHSLLATQVVSRIRERFELDLSLRTFFESPTVAETAALIEGNRIAGLETAVPAIPRRRAAGPAELSFAQQRLWFLEQWEPATPIYNIPAAVRLEGVLHVDALAWSLNRMVRRHQALRTTFTSEQGRPVQVVAPVLIVSQPVIDLRQLPAAGREAEALRLTREEARRPFDLVHGPLLRAILLRLDEMEHMLLVTMHHIVSDAWSMGVFIREIGSLYQACAAGDRVCAAGGPGDLPIQYADFA